MNSAERFGGPHKDKVPVEEIPFLDRAHTLVHEPFTSYQSIHDRLEQSGVLDETLKIVKEIYAEELSEAKFLTESDWGMLATLWLYDEETATHSVDTYRIAYDRIHEPLQLTDPVIKVDLLKVFSREGVTEEQFLRACLLHDIGKLAMPIEVLTNHTTDIECAVILYEHYDSLDEQVRTTLHYPTDESLPTSPSALLLRLRLAHIRPQELVPIRFLLASEKECLVVSDELAQLGLSLDNSLLTIMRTHDKYSRDILKEANLPLESDLAGAHHRHEKEYSPMRHSLTIGVEEVSIDLSDIIHLSDVTQAMKSRRHYKHPESSPIVLAELAAHSDYDMVDPFITYLWIVDRLQSQPRSVDPVDEAAYQTIQIFLDKKREMYTEQLKKYQLIQETTG